MCLTACSKTPIVSLHVDGADYLDRNIDALEVDLPAANMMNTGAQGLSITRVPLQTASKDFAPSSSLRLSLSAELNWSVWPLRNHEILPRPFLVPSNKSSGVSPSSTSLPFSSSASWLSTRTKDSWVPALVTARPHLLSLPRRTPD